jgi:hypothetical protein
MDQKWLPSQRNACLAMGKKTTYFPDFEINSEDSVFDVVLYLYEPLFWRFARWRRMFEPHGSNVYTVESEGWWFAPQDFKSQRIIEGTYG